MNSKPSNMTALALLPAALLTFNSCSSPPPPAVGAARIDYTKGVPGGTIVQTFKTTATLTAINPTKRTATLRESDGKKFAVELGRKAGNFDQVHIGDQVNATVVQKIVASLDPERTAAGAGAAAVVTVAPKGDQPDGLVAETTQVTGTIIALDAARHTVTLRFEDRNPETFPIRSDVALSRHKIGDQVVFRVVEMTAIRVEKFP